MRPWEPTLVLALKAAALGLGAATLALTALGVTAVGTFVLSLSIGLLALAIAAILDGRRLAETTRPRVIRPPKRRKRRR